MNARKKFILLAISMLLILSVCLIPIVNIFSNYDPTGIDGIRTFAKEYALEEKKTVDNKKQVSNIKKKHLKKELACYLEPSTTNSIKLFNESDITDDKNIFFIETTCSDDQKVNLNPRQLCAIESTAQMNPTMKIYLLILSPWEYSPNTRYLLSHLESNKNIFIRRVLIDNFMENTPLEDWWKSGAINSSVYPLEHVADVLRCLVLWKFPGIYMDLDIVTLSSFENLRDFVGAEDASTVANGIMSFGKTEIARKIVNDYINNLKTKFRGDIWSNNGPVMLTGVLAKVCNTDKVSEMVKNCHGFTVFQPEKFYYIHWSNWIKFFQTENQDEVPKLIEKSLVTHVWNKLSYSTSVRVGSKVPYGMIANQFCPKIYNNCGLWF